MGHGMSSGLSCSKWTVSEVEAALRSLGPAYEQYCCCVADNGVDGSFMVKLEREDLTELGIESLLHQKKLLLEIAKLKKALANTVEGFLEQEDVSAHAACALRSLSPTEQAKVLSRGSVSSARDATAALLARVREVELARSRSPRPAAAAAAAATAAAAEQHVDQQGQRNQQREEEAQGSADERQLVVALAPARAADLQAAAKEELQTRLNTGDLRGYPATRVGYADFVVMSPQAPGEGQRRAHGYLDGRSVEARLIELEVAFTQRSLSPYRLSDAAILYHVEIPRDRIHSGHKRGTTELKEHASFHKAGCICSDAWLSKAFHSNGTGIDLEWARRAVALSYKHRIKSRAFWQDLLGPSGTTSMDDIKQFIVEALVVPKSEMEQRETELGALMGQSCLALRRPAWQPPDEKAWHHFAGPADLRLL